MINLKLVITYKGTKYFGWQKQRLKPTIQETIELAFQKLFQHQKKIQVFGSGRTDTGVHALGQVAHTLLEIDTLTEADVLKRLNFILPFDIRIISLKQMPLDFHARFSAKKREYKYYMCFKPPYLPFFQDYMVYYPYPIQWSLLKKSLKYFLGEKDFSTFSNSDHETTPLRTLYQLNYKVKKNIIIFTLVANSFLAGMVRNILGTIFRVNKCRQNPEIIEDLFSLKNNAYSSGKIDPKGLFLHKVYY